LWVITQQGRKVYEILKVTPFQKGVTFSWGLLARTTAQVILPVTAKN